MDNMENREFLLTNEELPFLSEFIEGSTICDFFGEFETVADAIHTCDVGIEGMRPKQRLLFVLRAFYLLGMLRGGESYRDELLAVYNLDDMTFEKCQFKLCGALAETAKFELESMEPTEVNKLLRLLGLGK